MLGEEEEEEGGGVEVVAAAGEGDEEEDEEDSFAVWDSGDLCITTFIRKAPARHQIHLPSCRNTNLGA